MLNKNTFRALLGARSPARDVDDARPANAAARPAHAADARARAAALRDDGRFGAALALLRTAAGDAGADVDVVRLLASWGRTREACELASRVSPDACDATALADLASVLLRGGEPARASAAVERALAQSPDHALALQVRARVLAATGRAPDALALHERLTTAAPDRADAWLLRAEAHAAANDLAAARRSVEQALELDPARSRAWEVLGAIEGLEDRLPEAIAALERAEALDPAGTIGDAFVNLAVCLHNAGRWAEAEALLMRELPARPHVMGHMTLGPVLLVQGRMAEGWRQYEFRWLSSALASGRPAYEHPAWDGQPLEGKTILLVAEQGIGDLFQFSRYFPLLQARGARVLVQIPLDVGGIADRLPGIDVPIRGGESLPRIDYFSFLLSLPRAFGTRLDSIPPCAPALRPLPERRARWSARLGARDEPRVGVVWAGSPKHLRDRHRSMRLDALAPALSIPGIRFIGLQKGPAVRQAESVPESFDFESLGPELDDLEDAAAVIDSLDLLVTVDTGLAHLAGVMGKPVWLLNANPPDFRWLTSGDDGVWYPTIRQFRQDDVGDWHAPALRLAAALRSWADAWHATSGPATKPAPPMAQATVRPVPSELRPRGLSRMAVTRSGYIQFDPDEPDVGVSIEQLGEWMPRRLDLAIALARPGATIVEAGAGVGMHTIPIAKAVGARGTIIAYESRPAIRRMLAQNLAANAVANVSVLARELVGSDGPDGDTIDDLGLERLDGVVFGDGHCASRAMAGAVATLWRCRPWIVCDARDPAIEAALAKALRPVGYRLWLDEGPCYSPANFNRREHDPLEGRASRTLMAIPEERAVDVAIDGCREIA